MVYPLAVPVILRVSIFTINQWLWTRVITRDPKSVTDCFFIISSDFILNYLTVPGRGRRLIKYPTVL